MNLSVKDLFICKICNKYYANPVNLCCFCVVCKCHTTEMQRDEITNKVKCQLCSEEFDYPLNGFKENQRLKQIIENDQHLSNEREKTLKKH